MLKDLLKACIRPLGVDLVRYPPLSPLARQLKAFLHSNDINLVLDVGACDGGFCRFLRGPVGYQGRIVSFEPTKKTFGLLQDSMTADANWTGYNVGVSDSDRQGVLNTYGDRYDFNSVLTLRENDASSYDVDLTRKGVEQIELRSIGSLWSEIARGLDEPRVQDGYPRSRPRCHSRGGEPHGKHRGSSIGGRSCRNIRWDDIHARHFEVSAIARFRRNWVSSRQPTRRV